VVASGPAVNDQGRRKGRGGAAAGWAFLLHGGCLLLTGVLVGAGAGIAAFPAFSLPAVAAIALGVILIAGQRGAVALIAAIMFGVASTLIWIIVTMFSSQYFSFLGLTLAATAVTAAAIAALRLRDRRR
jgi:hypothetical protein